MSFGSYDQGPYNKGSYDKNTLVELGFSYGTMSYGEKEYGLIQEAITASSSSTCSATITVDASASISCSSSASASARRIPLGSALVNGTSTTSVTTTSNGARVRTSSATSDSTATTNISYLRRRKASAAVSSVCTVSAVPNRVLHSGFEYGTLAYGLNNYGDLKSAVISSSSDSSCDSSIIGNASALTSASSSSSASARQIVQGSVLLYGTSVTTVDTSTNASRIRNVSGDIESVSDSNISYLRERNIVVNVSANSTTSSTANKILQSSSNITTTSTSTCDSSITANANAYSFCSSASSASARQVVQGSVLLYGTSTTTVDTSTNASRIRNVSGDINAVATNLTSCIRRRKSSASTTSNSSIIVVAQKILHSGFEYGTLPYGLNNYGDLKSAVITAYSSSTCDSSIVATADVNDINAISTTTASARQVVQGSVLLYGTSVTSVDTSTNASRIRNVSGEVNATSTTVSTCIRKRKESATIYSSVSFNAEAQQVLTSGFEYGTLPYGLSHYGDLPVSIISANASVNAVAGQVFDTSIVISASASGICYPQEIKQPTISGSATSSITASCRRVVHDSALLYGTSVTTVSNYAHSYRIREVESTVSASTTISVDSETVIDVSVGVNGLANIVVDTSTNTSRIRNVSSNISVNSLSAANQSILRVGVANIESDSSSTAIGGYVKLYDSLGVNSASSVSLVGSYTANASVLSEQTSTTNVIPFRRREVSGSSHSVSTIVVLGREKWEEEGEQLDDWDSITTATDTWLENPEKSMSWSVVEESSDSWSSIYLSNDTWATLPEEGNLIVRRYNQRLYNYGGYNKPTISGDWELKSEGINTWSKSSESLVSWDKIEESSDSWEDLPEKSDNWSNVAA